VRIGTDHDVLNHSFSELMASFLHRTSLSRGPEEKPTGTDENWCGQQHARSFGPEVGREGGARSRCGPCAPEMPWPRMHGFSLET
jgi:hypothetical protein